MKYPLLMIVLLVFFLGCSQRFWDMSSYVTKRIYIGMPIDEFKKIANGGEVIEAMEQDYTVFVTYGLNGYLDKTFYYFNKDGKLQKVDKGQFKQQRYQIEVINKNE